MKLNIYIDSEITVKSQQFQLPKSKYIKQSNTYCKSI